MYRIASQPRVKIFATFSLCGLTTVVAAAVPDVEQLQASLQWFFSFMFALLAGSVYSAGRVAPSQTAAVL